MDILMDWQTINAKDTLEKCRKIIKKNKHKPSDVKILNPSDISDWKKIKSYKRVSSNRKSQI